MKITLGWWLVMVLVFHTNIAMDTDDNVMSVEKNDSKVTESDSHQVTGNENEVTDVDTSTQQPALVEFSDMEQHDEQGDEMNSTEERDDAEEYTGNIPPHIEPLNYSITLKVNLRDSHYSGRTQVLIEMSAAFDMVPIHSDGLQINDVFLASYDELDFGIMIEGLTVYTQESEDLLRIYVPKTLPPGLYILILDFERDFADTFWGFYTSSWVDEDGWVNQMATTQFSPYFARKAWPCYDEPRFKARFRFFVEHESMYNAVSNGALQSREIIRPGWVVSSFEWTPPMSTYITAVIVTNYRYIEGESQLGVPIRVYGSPSSLKHSAPQLDDLSRAMDFFEEYLEVKYAMDKLYLMPVRKYGVAAMENWGLITAREDIANWNIAEKGAQWELHKRVILDHEVAHLWFGNLVTPHWWDSIILKESTVSWLMVFAADSLYDDFDFKDEFVVLYDLLEAMELDASVDSRPAIFNPGNKNEIMNLFDLITYNRGGCIFRMIYHIVGPGAFRSALHNYLVENAFGTATMEDMNRYLEAANPGSDITETVNRFTKQKNFPLVHVSMVNRTHVRVRQQRFLYSDKNAVQDSMYNYTWYIPFTYTTDSERNDQVIILKEVDNIVKLRRPAKWIKANNDMRMFYITNYDHIEWMKLYHQLAKDHTVFTPTDRAQLLADLLNLATAEKLPINFLLQFISYLRHEKEFTPWKIAAVHMTQLINDRMSPAEKYAAKIFMRDLIDTRLKEVLQWNTSYEQPIKQRLLQSLLLETGIHVEHPDAMEFVDKLNEISRRKRESGETAGGVEAIDTTEFAILAIQEKRKAQANVTFWNELFNTIPSIETQNHFSEVFKVLSSTNNKTAIGEVLRLSLAVNNSDAMYEGVIVMSENHPDTVWDFVKRNYDHYFRVFGESQFLMTRITQNAVQRLRTQSRYDEVKEFFAVNSPGTGQQGVDQGLEKIAENIRWLQRHRRMCRKFFFTYAKNKLRRYSS